MDPVTIGAIIGGAGTALGGVVAAVQKSRSAAVDAAESAVSVVKSAMDTQGETVTSLQRRVDDQGARLTDSERQITRQAERITDLDQRHGVAIDHIARREDAADEHLGTVRPAWLPQIPDLIRPDVDAARRPR
ncbi:hypothetical protein [Corynebacterium provencense]|uniref:hypothetical protein n=1 Tax=Corynebacterium provencense TaxID=1737425 RepID=UPI0008303E98|nr:hypothetical protein [Corynebacterium provencense]